MISINHRSGAVRTAIAAPALVLLLAGCGGSSSGATSSASATSTAAATPGSGGVGGGRGGVDFAAIQTCLKAAGIPLPTPSGSFTRRSGAARPSFTPPAGGANGTPPSGARRGNGGFGGGQFRSAKVQAALKACGITLPTRAAGGAQPSGTPTGA